MAIREIPYSQPAQRAAVRKGRLAAGDAPAVVGMDALRGGYTLWAEKTGRVLPAPGQPEGIHSRFTELTERLFEYEAAATVQHCDRLMINEDYPWAYAGLHATLAGEKTAFCAATVPELPQLAHTAAGEAWPAGQLAAAWHLLAVTGYEKAVLALAVDCRRLEIYSLQRDEAEIRALMAAEQAFYTYIEKDTPPPVDGLPCTGETLTRLYPESGGARLNLAPWAKEIADYARLELQIDELAKQKALAANRLRAVLGRASGGETDRYRVECPARCRISLNAEKYERDHPGIGPGYYHFEQSRPLRVVAKEEQTL